MSVVTILRLSKACVLSYRNISGRVGVHTDCLSQMMENIHGNNFHGWKNHESCYSYSGYLLYDGKLFYVRKGTSPFFIHIFPLAVDCCDDR